MDLTAATARARSIADDLLFPAAQRTDAARSVPREYLDALRDAGLNGVQGPAAVPGGLGAGHVEARPVFEAVAGGCGATAFVWAQHHGAVRRLAGGDGPARATWLPRLCDGSALAGIGFAYLRRPGPPAVRATPAGDGWRLDGEAPWITGWGLADVFVLMAKAEDGRVVTVVVDGPGERAELTAGPPQRLAVMGATATVALRIDGLILDAGSVAGVQTHEEWSSRDRVGSALPAAAPLGIAGRAIRCLGDAGARGAAAAVALEAELEARRADADAAARAVLDAAAGDDRDLLEAALDAGTRERDRGIELAGRAADALVAASGGAAMARSHPAQRLVREAAFYLIQAQTGALREATLARLSRRPGEPR